MIFSIESKRLGEDQIEVTISAGLSTGSLEKRGTLILSVGEWQIFAVALSMGVERTRGHMTLILHDCLG